tara:strand:- start:1190 stop:2344 length:1155 start_codon:yes stop_codon:yes gene_type:complete
MTKSNFFNIIDYGLSKIRIAIFDSNLNICYSESILKKSIDKSENNFDNLKDIIRKAEKKISSHIEDIILILDSKKTLVIDVSLQKKLDGNMDFTKAYEFLTQEIYQIISDNYNEYEIIHTIFNNGIVDEKIFDSLPKNVKDVKQIKIDYKVILFPKKNIQNINNYFNKNNLSISKIFCTSYLKSQSYLSKLNLDKVSFLDIGYERSSLVTYENKKLKYVNSINVGSHNITKDISKIFKIEVDHAEKIKKLFNKSETEFSYNNNRDTNLSLKEIIKKNISIDLLKQVVLYRVQEIFDLTFNKSSISNFNFEETNLFLIGDGSIMFNNNSFYLNDKFGFKSINYFEESDIQICNSGASYYVKNFGTSKITYKKRGLFERFFNLFDI